MAKVIPYIPKHLNTFEESYDLLGAIFDAMMGEFSFFYSLCSLALRVVRTWGLCSDI